MKLLSTRGYALIRPAKKKNGKKQFSMRYVAKNGKVDDSSEVLGTHANCMKNISSMMVIFNSPSIIIKDETREWISELFADGHRVHLQRIK